MVAIINHSKCVRSVLNYNEKKVADGKADLILASRFLCEIDSLTFSAKLNRFRHLNESNPRVKTNTLHISLNFDPSETLPTDKLQEISAMYMDKIGFGDQPFLVYQHKDASHPHVHIVSSLIKRNGQRINTHNIGRNLSEPARKELENIFGLVRANHNHHQNVDSPSMLRAAIYGQTETKQSINSVLAYVLKEYRFTSIPELNAALKQFNITADIGEEGSYLRRHKGIQYRTLTHNGERIGVPIKGSALPGKPTLSSLNKKFHVNEILRKAHKQQIANFLTSVLSKNRPRNTQQFRSLLSGHKIDAVYQINTSGRLYGVTFVDNNSRCVFKGSDLSKELSAANLLKAFENNCMHLTTTDARRNPNCNTPIDDKKAFDADLQKLANLLSREAPASSDMPYDLSSRKKRKRKKNTNN